MSIYYEYKQSDVVLKTSLFAHVAKGGILWNDLHNRFSFAEVQKIAILKTFATTPQSINSYLKDSAAGLAEKYVQELVNDDILVPKQRDESTSFYPHRIEIETTKQCNASCVYCPQSVHRKPKGFMADHVFEKIISDLTSYKHVAWVSLSHYGEPLLDPHFKKRVECLTRNGHKLLLFTNATLLTEEIIQFLEDQALYGVLFNFPSLDPREWSSWMNLPQDYYYRAVKNIVAITERLGSKLHQLGIIVNVVTYDQADRMDKIKDYFSAYGEIEVLKSDTNSRAGAISNQYIREVDWKQNFFAGCERIVGHLHVSSEGKCYLCCQDFHQKTILGDLMTNNISEIMQSEYVSQLRSEIYGEKPMREHLLCRSCTRLRSKKFVEE